MRASSGQMRALRCLLMIPATVSGPRNSIATAVPSVLRR
jgi:hypothetical protein